MHSAPAPIQAHHGSTVKLLLLVVVPPALVTDIVPLVAPAGTVAVMYPEASTTEAADLPLKVTAVVPTNAEPLSVIFAPTNPLVGVNSKAPGAGEFSPRFSTEIAPWSCTSSEFSPPLFCSVT